MNTFDRNRLNTYADRMLDHFLFAFPKETIYSIVNSEDYFQPDGDRFVGAWVIEWLCPAGGYDWNVMLSSEEQQLIIRWASDHEHFINWDKVSGDPEISECLNKLKEIFDEAILNVGLYKGDEFLYGRWYRSDKIDQSVFSEEVTKYKVQILAWNL